MSPLGVENRLWLCVSHGYLSLSSFWVIVSPVSITFITYVGWFILFWTWRWTLCSSLEFSFYVTLSSLYSFLWTPASLVPLDSHLCVFNYGILLDYTLFFLSAPESGNFLKVVSWDNQRSHFICFSYPRGLYPLLSNIQRLENQCFFIYFVCSFISVRQEGTPCPPKDI